MDTHIHSHIHFQAAVCKYKYIYTKNAFVSAAKTDQY